MSDFKLSLDNPFIRGLACAAISPGLRSILVFDIQPEMLRSAGTLLAEMLKATTGQEFTLTSLIGTEADDDLWGGLVPFKVEGKAPFFWQPGPLSGGQKNTKPHIVLIPDLTRLGLTAARACVTLIGSDVAHLERHGQHQRWLPNICWLAGCASDEVGQISSHLLDRFALRLNGKFTTSQNRTQKILANLEIEQSPINLTLDDLPSKIRTQLHDAVASLWPQMIDDAANRILEFFTVSEKYSARREIALARLARTIVCLNGETQVQVSHVIDAAEIIGLKLPAQDTDTTEHSSDEPDKSDDDLVSDSRESQTPEKRETPPSETEVKPHDPAGDQEPVYQSDTDETLTSMPSEVGPYPEDYQPNLHEIDSLKLPIRRYRATTLASGPVIGTSQATGLYDLALVSTVLEAAKFQPIRRKHLQTKDNSFLVSPTDLRSYRRAPVAEQMLVLLFDYTCLSECVWEDTLFEYLNWAYIERASICLIKVGASNAPHELRAERIIARNILAPRISAALEVKSGKATPLAHGFDLALQTLRHALQHGRGTIQKALFVVLTDGRGNIPLKASRLGYVAAPVNREGIDDVLRIAQHIRELDNVSCKLLNPQPQQYSDLPIVLAEALGAGVVEIPTLENLEEW